MKIKNVKDLRQAYPELIKQIEDEAIRKIKVDQLEEILTPEDAAVINLSRCMNRIRK
ncbi:hypothetical protein CcarbDRAFT_4350 [Clostridium carboxidivorans P7]|uniref:Uncharacterized protein n=1 Tax=Clostridium carboxidivorans P7 TaxID=536227 RepID=C6PZY3_9CLOT|nr:hypothetical protein [Clostridium carboxidivorans]ADO12135.1 hypothetical protein Ccar_4295 [Clostridium carboxidivorans P7]EET85193.1 hypothetical protein CcarbDRAFT_4350 [Clostridium carboxidivorans P7]EFG87531.1 hypothetical protein CLCAR_3066 [Clostridium carboxidivorans P7]